MNVAGPTLFQGYCRALREHAHHLIARGYEQLRNAVFTEAEEQTITGALVSEMRRVLESETDAPTWASHYSIHEDPPLSVPGRRGRARPRVDIELERLAPGRRPRLRFEAKRLCSPGHPVRSYLGEEGLGCFLSEKYPTTHGEAGMLGYVQSEDEGTWAAQLAHRLDQGGEEYRSVPPPFAQQAVDPALLHTYASHHQVRSGEERIVVHHVLLRFA